MTPTEPQRWYHLHLGTWAVVLVMAVCLVLVNWCGIADPQWQRITHGWPFGWVERLFWSDDLQDASDWKFGDAEVHQRYEICLYLNVVVAIAIVGMTTFTTEYLVRRGVCPFRFGLKTILAITVAAGVFLACHRYGYADWVHLALVPVYFGVGCVFVTAGIGVRALLGGSMIASKSTRPWYHVHAGTWGVVSVVAVSLLTVNLRAQLSIVSVLVISSDPIRYQEVLSYGWPWSIFYANPPTGGPVFDLFSARHLSINILVAAIILFSTGLSSEILLRRGRSPFRFGNQAILAVTVAAGIFLTLNRVGAADWVDLFFVPAYFGVACIAVAAGIGVDWLQRTNNRAPD